MNFSISSLSPIKVFLSTWSLWLIAFLLKPFDYTYNNFSFESATIFILLNLFFLFGMYLGINSKNNVIENKFILKNKSIVKIYNILFFVALFSCFLRLYSIFFIQNYFSFESSYDFKMSIMYVTSSAGVVGILSSITLPSTILILYLNLFYRIVSFKSFKGLVTIIASLLIVIDSFLKSSFLYIVVYFLLVLFSLILKKNYIDNKKFEIKLFLFIPVFGLLISYFAYIYQFRIYDIDYVLYDRNIIPNKSFNNYFDFTIINFVHYMLHGYYQWVDLYNIVGLNNYSYGFIQFYPIVKFFKSFVYSGLPSMLDLLSVLPRGAVYYTFWGDFILDFGLLSIPISLIFGFFTSKLYLNFKRKYFISTIFYPFIVVIVFFMPYLNLASGMIGYFVAFILALKLIVTVRYVNNVK